MIVNGSCTPFREGDNEARGKKLQATPPFPICLWVYPFSSQASSPWAFKACARADGYTVQGFLVPKFTLGRMKAPINTFEVQRYPQLFRKKNELKLVGRAFSLLSFKT